MGAHLFLEVRMQYDQKRPPGVARTVKAAFENSLVRNVVPTNQVQTQENILIVYQMSLSFPPQTASCLGLEITNFKEVRVGMFFKGLCSLSPLS